METPVQVTFRGMPASDALEQACLAEAAKLEEFFDRITGCHVTLQVPHRHHRQGNLVEVRVDLVVPRGEIVVSRTPSFHQADEDPLVAVRGAFDAARRQLEDHVRKLRGDVKSHTPPPHGRVLRTLPEEGYGFLESDDGREVYFHANSLVNAALEELEPGTPVAFREADGPKGPRATSVRRLRVAGS